MEDLFIDPEYRGKGYGKALLKKLAKIVVDRGYGRFEWTCLSWNQPSIDFYLSLGAKQKDWNVFHLTGDELKVAEIALIENVQRKDLNPIEEAMAYRALIEKFGLKQEEVAQQAGKSRSAVANMLRLLELPDEVLELVQDEKLSMGHARALLGLDDDEKMLPLANTIVEKELSVREVEALVRRYNIIPEENVETVETNTEIQRKIYMKDLEDKARTRLGRKVKIHETNRKKTVELTYEDDEDLENLLKILVGQDIFE